MFKKTLLAATVGVLITPVAMAGDINSQSERTAWANEALGLAGAGDVVTAGALTAVLNAEFAVNDIVTLAFTGAALDETTVPTTIVAANAGNATVTFGLLNADASSAQFRVTEIDTGPGTTTVGLPVPFAAGGDLEFDPDAVAAAGGVTVSYSAETNNGLPLDTGDGPEFMGGEFGSNSRTVLYIQTGNYFGVDTDPVFDDTIDVNTQRTTLVDGNIGTNGDNGRFDATLNTFEGTDTQIVVAFDDHDPSFSGDFSWITDTDENADDIQPGVGVVTVVGCDPADVTVTATTISAVDCTSPFAELRLDPGEQDPLTTLAATTYTASTEINYSDIEFGNSATGVLDTGSFPLGAWDLNGFQTELSYTPFGPGLGQIIYFANRSSQDGEITIDWIDQNQDSGSFTVGTSLAGSTISIGPLIAAGLPAAQQNGGRLAITVTVNVPACDGQVNAQYIGNGNRAFTSQRDNCPIDANAVNLD